MGGAYAVNQFQHKTKAVQLDDNSKINSRKLAVYKFT